MSRIRFWGSENISRKGPLNCRSLGCARRCDFIIFRCSLRPESSQEHLPTSIAGVLRLRAIKPSVSDRSAKRFAQDDGFVRGLEIQLVGYAETLKDRKRHKLSGGQSKEWRFHPGLAEKACIPPFVQ
jgi:hypothetical protein